MIVLKQEIHENCAFFFSILWCKIKALQYQGIFRHVTASTTNFIWLRKPIITSYYQQQHQPKWPQETKAVADGDEDEDDFNESDDLSDHRKKRGHQNNSKKPNLIRNDESDPESDADGWFREDEIVLDATLALGGRLWQRT